MPGGPKKTHPNLILLYRAIDLNNTKKPLRLAYLNLKQDDEIFNEIKDFSKSIKISIV